MRLKLSLFLVFFITVLSTARVKAFNLNPDFMGQITFDKSYGYLFRNRVSREVRNIYYLGVSYLKEKNICACFREEARVDLWFLPKIEETGRPAIKITKSMNGPFIFCGIWEF